jgi:hypothetical protein
MEIGLVENDLDELAKGIISLAKNKRRLAFYKNNIYMASITAVVQ